MSPHYRYSIIGLLSLLTFVTTGYAQLSVQLANQDAFGRKVDASRYPICKVTARATNGATSIPIDLNNIYFVQNGQRALPFRVQPAANNYYDVFFNSRSEGSSSVEVIVTHQGNAESSIGRFDSTRLCLVRFLDAGKNPIKEVKFDNLSSLPMIVQAFVGKTNPDGTQTTVLLDSLSISSPDFSIRWVGSAISQKEPPVEMQPGFENFFYIDYKSQTSGYVREYLTAHFEAGGQVTIPITVSRQALPEQQQLILEYPNGTEIFAPCQKIMVKWRGYSPDSPTLIDISTNGGTDWESIGQSNDSTFLWTVPDNVTENAMIRVRQLYSSVQETNLQDQKDAFGKKVNFIRDGSTMLSGYDNGFVTEWDVLNKSKLAEYSVNHVGFPIVRLTILGVGYGANQRPFVAYRDGTNSQKIAFFDRGNSTPTATYNLPLYRIREVVPSVAGDFLVIVPELGANITIVSSTDASIQRRINFDAPISAFSLNEEKAVAGFLSGKITTFSLPGFIPIDSIIVPELSIAHSVAVTNDGTLIGAASRVGVATLYDSPKSVMLVGDMSSKKVVRYNDQLGAGTNPLGLAFSKSNRYLAVGYKNQPQVSVLELPGNGSFLGSISGHSTDMSSIQFSPDGKTIATSADAQDNVKIRRITFPETDISDRIFSIRKPIITSQTISIPPTYLSQIRDSVIIGGICNTGSVKFIIDYARFQFGVHFSLLEELNTLDTIKIGECLLFSLRTMPLDTGIIRDTLYIGSCGNEYRIPLELNSLNRDISLLADNTDFGESCTGTSVVKSLIIARNNDPIPLIINSIQSDNPNFSIISIIKDTVLQPGQTLSATISFLPQNVGEINAGIIIYHSNQTKISTQFTLVGTGVGADIAVVSKVYFIPEILTRTIEIKNNSNNTVDIISIENNPLGIVSASPSLPISIPALSSQIITLSLTRELLETEIDTIIITATPCATKRIIEVLPYSAVSSVSLPNVKANPRGEAIIPIEFSNTEPAEFGANRIFSAEISMNPRMFLPRFVQSQFGTGTLIKNEIVNDKRIIGFSINGNFPSKGIVGEIVGDAAMAEVLESPIIWENTSRFWGKSVNISTANNGSFSLTEGICGDPRVFSDGTILSTIVPNPANDAIEINIESQDEYSYNISCFNQLGHIVFTHSVTVPKGMHSIPLPVNNLQNGMYMVYIQTHNSHIALPLFITR